MKIKIVQYTPSYFGIIFSEKQLRLLRRIASDQAIPVERLIQRYVERGFAKTEWYKFS